MSIDVRRISFWGLLAAVVLALVYVGSQRPVSIVSAIHTPNEKHIHQVYAENFLSQHLVAPVNSIDGLRLWLAEDTSTPPNAIVTLHVRPAGSSQDVRTVSGPLSAFVQEHHIEYYDDVYSLDQVASTIFFPFERIQGSRGKAYDFVLTADVAPRQALRVRYESDEKKFSGGRTFSAQGAEQGNLGFILYERPNLLQIAARWTVDPRNVLFWFGLGALLVGFGLWWRYRRTISDSQFWEQAWRGVFSRASLPWLGFVILLTFGMYWPALNQFFFHDDLALLARAQHFHNSPLELVSARAYLEVDEHSRFALPFWRPLSTSVYGWITVALFQLNGPVTFAVQLALVATTAACLWALTRLLLQNSLLATTVTALWLAHSSKLGTVYWWSSTQDVLSSLFLLAAILLYARWRAATRQPHLMWFSAAAALLAMLAKEHAILTPLFIWVAVELPGLHQDKSWRRSLWQSAIRVSPIVAVSGFYLILRTIALGEPGVPREIFVDPTYELTRSVSVVGQNIMAYAVWSAEHWLWPTGAGFVHTIHQVLGNWMWQVRITPPLYPGAFLIAFYVVLLAVAWRTPRQRSLVIAGGLWWLLVLGPVLLLAHHWFPRLLYLPMWGLALALGSTIALLPRQWRDVLSLVLLLAASAYGIWQARISELSKFEREQAQYSQVAFAQARSLAPQATPDSRVFLVGIPPHQTTSVNAYLLRLAGFPPSMQIIRVPELPPEIDPDDIVIDMTGHNAYYPQYDSG